MVIVLPLVDQDYILMVGILKSKRRDLTMLREWAVTYESKIIKELTLYLSLYLSFPHHAHDFIRNQSNISIH